MIRQLVLLAIAGAAGTWLRFSLATVAQRTFGPGFAWGTLVVNLLGCGLFGLVVAISDQRALISSETRLVLLTGFLGALTTFSTFAYESQQMLTQGRWLLFGANVAAQNLLGLAMIGLGSIAGRAL